MLRTGKQPIEIPGNVTLSVKDRSVIAEGPKGRLEVALPAHINAVAEGKSLRLIRSSETAAAQTFHGLARELINDAVQGVSSGFQKKLEIPGVGFKAAVRGNVVDLGLGSTHPIEYPIPAGITVVVEDGFKLTIDGADRLLVDRVAAEIKNFYPVPALTRDVVGPRTGPARMADVQFAAVLGKTKSLSDFRSQIGWK